MKSKLELQKEKLEKQIEKLRSQLKDLNKKIDMEQNKAREEKLLVAGKMLEEFHVINLDQPLNEMEKCLSDFLSEAEWNLQEDAAVIEPPANDLDIAEAK